jgi:hypothetical protein
LTYIIRPDDADPEQDAETEYQRIIWAAPHEGYAYHMKSFHCIIMVMLKLLVMKLRQKHCSMSTLQEQSVVSF